MLNVKHAPKSQRFSTLIPKRQMQYVFTMLSHGYNPAIVDLANFMSNVYGNQVFQKFTIGYFWTWSHMKTC